MEAVPNHAQEALCGDASAHLGGTPDPMSSRCLRHAGAEITLPSRRQGEDATGFYKAAPSVCRVLRDRVVGKACDRCSRGWLVSSLTIRCRALEISHGYGCQGQSLPIQLSAGRSGGPNPVGSRGMGNSELLCGRCP